MRNLVLMQKGHALDELKTKGHYVVRTITALQNLIKGRFPGQRDDRFADAEVDDVKQWDGMVRWRLDITKVLQPLTLVGINNCLEDDENTTL